MDFGHSKLVVIEQRKKSHGQLSNSTAGRESDESAQENDYHCRFRASWHRLGALCRVNLALRRPVLTLSRSGQIRSVGGRRARGRIRRI